MINIVQKGVERPCPLPNATIQDAPFLRREDARQQVEGDQPFRVAPFPINRESDADAAKDRLCLVHPAIEPGNACPFHPTLHFPITGAQRTVRFKHFVEGQSVDPPSAVTAGCALQH